MTKFFKIHHTISISCNRKKLHSDLI